MQCDNSKNSVPQKNSEMINLNKYPVKCPVQKIIMEILAVQVYEIRQTDLIDCLNRLEYKDKHKNQFSYKNIRPFLSAMKKNGLIIQTIDGFTCHDDVWFETINHLVMENRYKIIAAQVLYLIPLVKPHLENFYHFRTSKELFRALLIAIFSDEQFANLDLVYGSWKRIKKLQNKETSPLLILANDN